MRGHRQSRRRPPCATSAKTSSLFAARRAYARARRPLRTLGASLAHGGCVTDEGIQCPFTVGLGRRRAKRADSVRDSPEPLATPFEPARRRENEVIYLWPDSARRPPLWSVPDVFEDVADHVRGRVYHPALPDGRLRSSASRSIRRTSSRTPSIGPFPLRAPVPTARSSSSNRADD